MSGTKAMQSWIRVVSIQTNGHTPIWGSTEWRTIVSEFPMEWPSISVWPMRPMMSWSIVWGIAAGSDTTLVIATRTIQTQTDRHTDRETDILQQTHTQPQPWILKKDQEKTTWQIRCNQNWPEWTRVTATSDLLGRCVVRDRTAIVMRWPTTAANNKYLHSEPH